MLFECFGGGADLNGVAGVTAIFVSPDSTPDCRVRRTLRGFPVLFQEFYKEILPRSVDAPTHNSEFSAFFEALTAWEPNVTALHNLSCTADREM